MTKWQDNPLPAEVREPLIYVVRAGYAARGTVYILTGLLAGANAAGLRAETEDTQGAMRLVHHSPFGDLLLIALSVGLASYALWCLARAIIDPEREADRPGGSIRRIGFFFTGLIYTGLVFLALQTFMGSIRGDQGNRNARHWTARLMSFPLGRWAVAAVGIGFIGYMIGQIAASRRPSNDDQLAMRRQQRRWVRWMIRFGIVARALVFGMIGVFFIAAAIHFDARKVTGLDGTLRALRAEPAGRWLLGFVALGFIAYGAYDLILARYRVIRLDTPAGKT